MRHRSIVLLVGSSVFTALVLAILWGNTSRGVEYCNSEVPAQADWCGDGWDYAFGGASNACFQLTVGEDENGNGFVDPEEVDEYPATSCSGYIIEPQYVVDGCDSGGTDLQYCHKAGEDITCTLQYNCSWEQDENGDWNCDSSPKINPETGQQTKSVTKSGYTAICIRES
jgi:hypothetical protein